MLKHKQVLKNVLNELRTENIGILKVNNISNLKYGIYEFELIPAITDYKTLTVKNIVIIYLEKDNKTRIGIQYKNKKGNNSGQELKHDKQGYFIKINSNKLYL